MFKFSRCKRVQYVSCSNLVHAYTIFVIIGKLIPFLEICNRKYKQGDIGWVNFFWGVGRDEAVKLAPGGKLKFCPSPQKNS